MLMHTLPLSHCFPLLSANYQFSKVRALSLSLSSRKKKFKFGNNIFLKYSMRVYHYAIFPHIFYFLVPLPPLQAVQQMVQPMFDNRKKPVDFIMVGPFVDDTKRVTGQWCHFVASGTMYRQPY